MKLREFNEQGIAAFKSYLAECRLDPSLPLPNALLEDDSLTKVVSPTIEVSAQHFGLRRDAAEYLNELLKDLSPDHVANSAGLWTWLALFFFDEICPPKAGRHLVKNDYHYIYEPKNVRHSYRHLLHLAWRVLQVAPAHNRLFLGSAVSTLDKVTSEVMKRLYLTRIPCIFEVLDQLYWDEERGRSRPGIVSPERVLPGDLIHRLPIRMRQLEKTYDLFSLMPEQLIDLLGPEFVFESPPRRSRRVAAATA